MGGNPCLWRGEGGAPTPLAAGGHPHPWGNPCLDWKPAFWKGSPVSGEESSLLERECSLWCGTENSPRRDDYRPCGTKTTFLWRVNTSDDVLLKWIPPFCTEAPSF